MAKCAVKSEETSTKGNPVEMFRKLMIFPVERFFFPQEFCVFVWDFSFCRFLHLCRAQSRDSRYKGVNLSGQINCIEISCCGAGRPGWGPAGGGDAESQKKGELR